MSRRSGSTPSLGDVVKRRRQQLQLTQAVVAARVGCRPHYIGYVEAGSRRPSQVVLEKLADALDLDRTELLLLAYPNLRAALREPRPPEGTAWERFKANTRLHTRHGITRQELRALEAVALLGAVRTQRDFLFILQTIRQALVDE